MCPQCHHVKSNFLRVHHQTSSPGDGTNFEHFSIIIILYDYITDSEQRTTCNTFAYLPSHRSIPIPCHVLGVVSFAKDPREIVLHRDAHYYDATVAVLASSRTRGFG